MSDKPHEAAREGDRARLRRVLDAGADPDAVDTKKRTPLMLAALNRSAECVRLLLVRGADAHARDAWGCTPLVFARSGEVARLLLDAGADIAAANVYGKSPLAFAADRGDGEVVRVLLERGADPNVANEDGVTPLMLAAKHAERGLEMVEALLARGANVNAACQDGTTALMSAVHWRNPAAARAMCTAGADPDAVDSDGKTALAYAIDNDHVELRQILRGAGAMSTGAPASTRPVGSQTWRVKQSRCPSCGATRLTPARSPYIHCDFCAQLIDYDYKMAVEMARQPCPGAEAREAEYLAASAECQPAIAAAQQAGDQLCYARYMRRQYNKHALLYPELYPPRVREPEYRRRFIEFYVDTWFLYQFDPALLQLMGVYEEWAQGTGWMDGHAESIGFRHAYDAYRAYIRACADKYQRTGLFERHPDGISAETYVRIEMSQFFSHWMDRLSDADVAWVIAQRDVSGEYQEVAVPALGQLRCGGCGAKLPVAPGARQVLCEGCGHVLDATAGTFACPQCGDRVTFPVSCEQLHCPSCRTLFRR